MDDLPHQVTVDITIHKIISELDDLMVLAADPATAPFVLREAIAVGQMLNRAQLIASFIEARKPQLRVISNG